MTFKPLSTAFKTVALACAAVLGFAAPAHAQISGDVIKIGFITDMSGLYADIDGPGENLSADPKTQIGFVSRPDLAGLG